MEEKSNSKALVIILIIIIVALLCYIMYLSNNNTAEVSNTENQSLKVLDDITFDREDGSKMIVLKIKNTSDKTYVNVDPLLIYYDSNNMPVHEGWGARISYFAPGDERCVYYYDTIEEYSKVEYGLFDRDDNKKYVDLKDKITYNVEKSTEPDEDGNNRLTFTVENKSDKDAIVEFQVEYFDGEKLIFEEGFSDVIEANGSLDTYELYRTEFPNGKAFPEGYTYKVTLVEAVEEIEKSEELEEGDEIAKIKTEIEWDSLSDEEKIEHALLLRFKDAFGEKLDAAKIYVDKMYTPEEAKKDIDVELKKDEIAFEASIYFLPAEGADTVEFTIPDGEYDEETGWVKDVHRLGILTPSADEEGAYEIRNLGTGW